MYKLKEITDKDTWNNFIIESDFEFYSFLQSRQWWEFQKKIWKKITRYWIYESNKEKLIWISQIIKIRAKRGSYMFIPHWPLINGNFFEVLKEITPELKKIAKSEKFHFIRFNSSVKNTISNKNYFKELWFLDAPMHEHAEDTHLLDLNKSEEELLQNIKKKDRYYINRAIKEGVEVVKWNSKEQIEILADMHINHSKKVWYHPFSEKFINYLYEIFNWDITTISTRYNWKVESILMTIKFWKTCVYYIATSDIKNHKFSPNYLCQWEAIKQAKSDWCSLYNFWWVSPDDNPNHPIAWVTKFKRKFGWYDYSLLHAQDLPTNWKYWLNYIIESIRRVKRWYYYKKPV